MWLLVHTLTHDRFSCVPLIFSKSQQRPVFISSLSFPFNLCNNYGIRTQITWKWKHKSRKETNKMREAFGCLHNNVKCQHSNNWTKNLSFTPKMTNRASKQFPIVVHLFLFLTISHSLKERKNVIKLSFVVE